MNDKNNPVPIRFIDANTVESIAAIQREYESNPSDELAGKSLALQAQAIKEVGAVHVLDVSKKDPPSPSIEEIGEKLKRDAEKHKTFKTFKEGNKLNYSRISDYIHKKYNVISFNKAPYVYHEGMYIEGKIIIESEIKDIFDSIEWTGKIVDDSRQVMHHIINITPSISYPFNTSKNAFPVKNKVIIFDFDNSTWKAVDHSPEYRFTFKLPVVFNEEADPSFVEEVFNQWVNEEDVPLLFQIFAQAILQVMGMEFKKAHLIIGVKNSAKTTFVVHLLTAFFGEENISRVPLQALSEDRFSIADLEGMILNVYDDLSSFTLNDVGQFKALTGSQYHDILKKRQHRYRGRIYALNLFTCNQIPLLKDTLINDDAFFERFEIEEFIRVFPVNDNFKNKLITQYNLSAILNRTIEIIMDIKKNNLIRKSSSEDIKEIWLKNSDPYKLMDFIKLNFVPDPDRTEEIDKDEITQAQHKFARENKTAILDKDKLCQKLYRRDFSQEQPRTGDKRKRVLVGFKWRLDSPHRLRSDPDQKTLAQLEHLK